MFDWPIILTLEKVNQIIEIGKNNSQQSHHRCNEPSDRKYNEPSIDLKKFTKSIFHSLKG